MGTTSVSATLDQLVAETGWLRRLAGSLVKDQAAADDLVHDTVLIAAEQAPRDGRPLRPWLARVLHNRVRMRGRSAARRSRREQAVAELAVAPATPEEIVDRIELQRMLAGLVVELAQPLRDVVLLHYFEGLSSAAIGNRLGIADGTVRWRLKQAIDELRDRLEQRAPNRAWVAPLTGFAGLARDTGVAGAHMLLLGAIAAFLALVAVLVLLWQAALGSTTTAPRAHRAEPLTAIIARVVHASPGVDAMAPSPGSVPADPDQRRITGFVVDSAGRPVDDAELLIECLYLDETATGPTTVRTASNGAFGFEVDRDCFLSMTARKDDAESLKRELSAGDDLRKPWEPFVLRLAPAPVAVVKVVDASTGAPIAGARLSRDNFRGQLASAVSDTTGVARIRIAHGSRFPEHSWIAIDAPGYPSVSEELTNPDETHPEKPIERMVRLVRGVPVSGKVVGPDGRGVANSFVVVEDAADWESRVTDADGAFSVAVPRAGRYRARASPPGLMMRRNAADAVDIEVGADGRTDVVLQLLPEPHGELTGTVVDDAGNPVAGARVRSAGRELHPVVTDAHGRFSYHAELLPPPRPPGKPIRPIFLVAHHGSVWSAFTPVEIHNEDQNTNVTLQLGPAGIAGVVVDLEGTPVPGADIYLNPCCGGHGWVQGKHAEADAEGRFGFEVPRGDFVLSVRRSHDDDFDDRDDKTVSGGSHDVHLLLP